MEFIDLVGLLGAFLSGVTFFPQVYRTWKLKSAKEISLAMILIILLSNVVCYFTLLINKILQLYQQTFLSGPVR